MAVVIGVEKTLYAHAEVTLDRQLTAASQVLPLYPRLSVVPLLPDALRDRLPELPEVHLGEEARPLAWPRTWPRPAADGPRPDIVVLVIDSWRADALDGVVTPCMQRAAALSRRFDDHVSGGNGTRFGVFSMLYGLTWTFYAVAGAVGPVLMGRAFDTTGSYETLLTRLALGTVAVAALMLFLPSYRAIGVRDEELVSAGTP